jgi:hypothetical protein
MSDKYIVNQNPKNLLWYVLGDCGKFLMPVSDGYKDKEDAVRWMKGQHRADSNARGTASNALDRTKQLD